MSQPKPASPWPALAFWAPVAVAIVLCVVGRTAWAFLAAGVALLVVIAMGVYAAKTTGRKS